MLFLLLFLGLTGSEATLARQVELEPGLQYRRFDADAASSNPTRVHVLTLDPERFDLVLLNASQEGSTATPRTARGWSENSGLLAAINASLYQQDRLTSVALMQTRSHTNNSYVSKAKCVLGFDPLVDDVPRVRLIDRQCDALETWRARYGTLIQSIRMISCTGKNVWSQQARRSSVAALGLDAEGRIHLIHMTTPQSTHDLINMLRKLPLQLTGAMYLEGGTPAQLFVNHPELQLETAGVWCSERAEEGERALALPIPNVIGVVRR